MKTWVQKIGVTCVVLGALLLTAEDFLPLDISPSITGFFSSEPQAKRSYFRVVPTDSDALPLVSLSLMGVGALLVGLSFFLRPKQ